MTQPRQIARLACLPGLLVAAACQSTPGPASLTIGPSQYQQTVDAAVRVLRDCGYHPTLVDLQAGRIETTPRHAGGLLEPWRTDNADLKQSLQNTVSNQRRLVRVEFVPVTDAVSSAPNTDQLFGPAIPGSTEALAHAPLTAASGPIEVRVWVSLERSVLRGQKLSTYSGTLSSVWIDPDAPGTAAQRWTPIGRDPESERDILGLIAQGISPEAAPIAAP